MEIKGEKYFESIKRTAMNVFRQIKKLWFIAVAFFIACSSILQALRLNVVCPKYTKWRGDEFEFSSVEYSKNRNTVV